MYPQGTPGKFVDMPDILDNFEEILSGTVDDLPEGAFYMCGDMNEVKEKAVKLMASAAK
jgi:F0F1-type ATP synthase beta subunit